MFFTKEGLDGGCCRELTAASPYLVGLDRVWLLKGCRAVGLVPGGSRSHDNWDWPCR